MSWHVITESEQRRGVRKNTRLSWSAQGLRFPSERQDEPARQACRVPPGEVDLRVGMTHVAPGSLWHSPGASVFESHQAKVSVG